MNVHDTSEITFYRKTKQVFEKIQVETSFSKKIIQTQFFRKKFHTEKFFEKN